MSVFHHYLTYRIICAVDSNFFCLARTSEASNKRAKPFFLFVSLTFLIVVYTLSGYCHLFFVSYFYFIFFCHFVILLCAVVYISCYCIWFLLCGSMTTIVQSFVWTTERQHTKHTTHDTCLVSYHILFTHELPQCKRNTSYQTPFSVSVSSSVPNLFSNNIWYVYVFETNLVNSNIEMLSVILSLLMVFIGIVQCKMTLCTK